MSLPQFTASQSLGPAVGTYSYSASHEAVSTHQIVPQDCGTVKAVSCLAGLGICGVLLYQGQIIEASLCLTGAGMSDCADCSPVWQGWANRLLRGRPQDEVEQLIDEFGKLNLD